MKNPTETKHGFLSAWLAFHILGADQVMARQIALVKAGESSTFACDVTSRVEDNTTPTLLEPWERFTTCFRNKTMIWPKPTPACSTIPRCTGHQMIRVEANRA
jgi:hypothetical protein